MNGRTAGPEGHTERGIPTIDGGEPIRAVRKLGMRAVLDEVYILYSQRRESFYGRIY